MNGPGNGPGNGTGKGSGGGATGAGSAAEAVERPTIGQIKKRYSGFSDHVHQSLLVSAN